MNLHIILGLAYADIAQHMINAQGSGAYKILQCDSR